MRIDLDNLPDIVLLDVTKPGAVNEGARSIARRCSTVRTITLSVSEIERYVAQGLAAAARAHLPNGASGADIINAIMAFSRGASYVMLGMPTRLLMDAAKQLRQPACKDERVLTDREGQILAEVSRGLTNKEIARKLILSEKTIKNCMTHIMQKLKVRNRVEAVLKVQDKGAIRSRG
ncbi:MAG: response regulator transcription factor [Rhodospirillales bacterium]|nr:response regulator transcription factor [Rhodospirillales bacterium]